jgi:predicted O-methyltransferase YrrM
MRDDFFPREPIALARINVESEQLGFRTASERRTGALLQVLAASKPRGRLLELGTGTGVGTAWLLSGMDSTSTLDTVDNDLAVVAVARKNLGGDARVRFHVVDGEEWLRDYAKALPDQTAVTGDRRNAGARVRAAGLGQWLGRRG